MNNKTSEERDAAVSRGRQRSRLEPVSPALSGESTGAPASAGAPVQIPTGWEDLYQGDADRYCPAPGAPARYGVREDRLEYDPAEPDPEQPGLAPPPRGPRKKGIRGREQIIDAELAEVTYVHVTPEEYVAMVADSRWEALLASAPEPGTRAWQHRIARLAGRARGTNAADHAALYGRSEQWIYNCRKTWGNSGLSREARSAPAWFDRFEIRGNRLFVVVKVRKRLKEMPPDFMNNLSKTLNAIHANTEALVESQAELRAITLEAFEILRANFPDDTVAATVERFVDDALRDAD
jgi:hypothetical protein